MCDAGTCVDVVCVCVGVACVCVLFVVCACDGRVCVGVCGCAHACVHRCGVRVNDTYQCRAVNALGGIFCQDGKSCESSVDAQVDGNQKHAQSGKCEHPPFVNQYKNMK